MSLNSIGQLKRLFLTVVIISSFISPTHAQESEARVVDEVVAVVNNDVITLSMVKREMNEAITALVQEGKAEQEATSEVTGHQSELIASLVNEQLLLQQGKELSMTEDVEAEVNRRMLDVAKGQGIKTIEELRKAMKASGFDYDAVRQTMRKELTKQAVFSREVDAKIYYNLTSDELKKYFEAHKDKFSKPESVTLSEIFLSLAGKSEDEVKSKAEQLIAEARNGGDFGALAVANSERLQEGKPVAVDTKGKVGTFQLTDLRDNITAAILNLKVGGVSEPIRYDEGYQIIRVDDRIAGSSVPTFNEARARDLITGERAESARKEYMDKLRKEAYIKLAAAYRASVLPLLGLGASDSTSTSSTSPTAAASADKKPDTSSNKP